MAYKIKEDECSSCGVCPSDCPMDAISEKDGKYWIDPDNCTDCGACVNSCPVGAIVAG